MVDETIGRRAHTSIRTGAPSPLMLRFIYGTSHQRLSPVSRSITVSDTVIVFRMDLHVLEDPGSVFCGGRVGTVS